MPRIFADGRIEPDFYCADCCYVKVGYNGGICEGCKNSRKVRREARDKAMREGAAWAIACAAVLVIVILGCLILGSKVPIGY